MQCLYKNLLYPSQTKILLICLLCNTTLFQLRLHFFQVVIACLATPTQYRCFFPSLFFSFSAEWQTIPVSLHVSTCTTCFTFTGNLWMLFNDSDGKKKMQKYSNRIIHSKSFCGNLPTYTHTHKKKLDVLNPNPHTSFMGITIHHSSLPVSSLNHTNLNMIINEKLRPRKVFYLALNSPA